MFPMENDPAMMAAAKARLVWPDTLDEIHCFKVLVSSEFWIAARNC